MIFSLAVLLYSIAVLLLVAWMGDIGLRCVFGNEVKEMIPTDYKWKGGRPRQGDTLLAIGSLRSPTIPTTLSAEESEPGGRASPSMSRWRDRATGETRAAQAVVQYRPLGTYIWSLVWFLQEMVIFAVGARVFWKRPHDESARLFFWLCIVTVGAYMGGYHWTEIVVEPPLIYPFAAFAVFVPVVSLHFYLVFPRPNPVLVRYRRWVLGALYGIPTAYLAGLWGACSGRGGWRPLRPARVVSGLRLVRDLALGYIGAGGRDFGLCILCLVDSYRSARTRAERNQVQWILLASLLASLLIAYLLWQTWFDPSTLGRDSAAWPMFGVSLLYTLAYALSITRYKLMQVEEIINRSVVYFALSVTAGLLYSAVLMLSGMVFGDRLLAAHQTWRGAMVAGLTVIVILIVSELARERFQKAIDRRFYREKYKFDQAMRKMRLAVGSLVDRATLGRRLAGGGGRGPAAGVGGDLPGATRPGSRSGWWPATGRPPTSRRSAPTTRWSSGSARSPAVRVPHAMSLASASDPATDAMIALGGEVASALEADGDLAGLLVLGPKRSGMPYEDEEIAFLGALGSVATLALHSAGIQQTLESAQPGAARQGREDRRAAAADPGPPGPAHRTAARQPWTAATRPHAGPGRAGGVRADQGVGPGRPRR